MPRRTALVLGSGLALGALACGSLTWSLDWPEAVAFVDRDLRRDYGVALQAEPRVRAALLPLPRIVLSNVRLTADGPPDGLPLAQGGRLTVRLSLAGLLAGRAEAVSLGLDHARIALPEGPGDRRWSLPLERLSAGLARGEHPRRIALAHATVTGRDPRDGRPETVHDVGLVATWPMWSDALDLAGGLTWNGAGARFALSGLRPGRLREGRESPFRAALDWPAGSLSAEGAGRLEGGLSLTGQMRLSTRSLPETLAWIGGEAALAPLFERFSLQGRFEASDEGLRLPSMRVAVGSTVLEGAGSAELAGRRPSIRATLDARELNLAPVLAGLLRVAQGEEEDGAGPVDGGPDRRSGWGRRPLALGPLTGGDLDLRLSGERARIGPVLLEDLAAGVIVRADGIDATLGRASLSGGTLKGRLALSSPNPAEGETEVKAQGAFEGLDLGTLLVDLGEAGWMLGPTRGSFSLDGRGRDADGLVRRVSGRAVLGVEGGAITGLDLADVLQRSGGGAGDDAPIRRSGRTPFERAQVSMSFAGGVGEIDEGSLQGRTVSAALRGRISLPERSFAARAALTPRRTVAGETPHLPGAALFELAGPWDSVSVRVRQREGQREGQADGAGGALPDPSPPVALRARTP